MKRSRMESDALTVVDRLILWCGKSPKKRLIRGATRHHRLSQLARQLVEQARRGDSCSPCTLCRHPRLLYVREGMELVYHRCCGIDIHKKVIVACPAISTRTSTPRSARA